MINLQGTAKMRLERRGVVLRGQLTITPLSFSPTVVILLNLNVNPFPFLDRDDHINTLSMIYQIPFHSWTIRLRDHVLLFNFVFLL